LKVVLNTINQLSQQSYNKSCNLVKEKIEDNKGAIRGGI
jgi:hypothetical protein